MRRIKSIFISIALTWSLSTVFACASGLNKDSVYNALRDGANLLINESNLTDSIIGKPYCVFYLFGCRGFGSWMIAVDNKNSYTVFYVDSYSTTKQYQYNTTHLPDNDEGMNMLFSFLNTNPEYEHRFIDETYSPLGFYFSLFGSERNILFEWDQRTHLTNTETNSPVNIFMPICISFIMPELVF